MVFIGKFISFFDSTRRISPCFGNKLPVIVVTVGYRVAVGIGGSFKFSVAVGVGVTCKGSEISVAVHQSYGGKFMELVVGHPVFFTVSPGKVDFTWTKITTVCEYRRWLFLHIIGIQVEYTSAITFGTIS